MFVQNILCRKMPTLTIYDRLMFLNSDNRIGSIKLDYNIINKYYHDIIKS